jgi:TonB family protein
MFNLPITLANLSTSKYRFATLLLIGSFWLTGVNASKAALLYNNISYLRIDTINNDTVFVKVDKQPSFSGGVDAYTKFLSKNIQYPETMRDRQIEDDVNVQFIVEIDGSLSHFKVMNSPGYGCGDEAIRVMKLSPKWIPGRKNGRAVRVLFKMPVMFRLKYIQHKEGESSGMKLINGG